MDHRTISEGQSGEGVLAEERPPYDELRLLQSVAAGDVTATDRFYRTYADGVMRYAYRRVRGQFEDAQEITLDTFRAAIGLAHSYDGSCKVSTWLCSIARLKVADYWRKVGSRNRIPHLLLRSLDDPLMATEARYMSDGEQSAFAADEFVDEVLGCMSADEREAMMLRYAEQMSVREVAIVMNRSEKAVESLLSRARSKPKKFLEKFGRRLPS